MVLVTKVKEAKKNRKKRGFGKVTEDGGKWIWTLEVDTNDKEILEYEKDREVYSDDDEAEGGDEVSAEDIAEVVNENECCLCFTRKQKRYVFCQLSILIP